MTYMPKPWALNRETMESEFTIFEQTLTAHEKKARICTGLIALLHAQLSIFEGDPLPEVYPVNTNQKAQRWLILVYSSSIFLHANTALDLAIRGYYLEAEGVLRSLLESVAFVEYFAGQESKCLNFFMSHKGMPNKKEVFKFLKLHGRYPKGGPEKIIARFHASAHGNIHMRMKSWLIQDELGNIKGFHIHKFDPERFYKISHHLILPLIGCQQMLYVAFQEKMETNNDILCKWQMARPLDLIRQEFPELWFDAVAKEFSQ